MAEYSTVNCVYESCEKDKGRLDMAEVTGSTPVCSTSINNLKSIPYMGNNLVRCPRKMAQNGHFWTLTGHIWLTPF